MVSLLTTDDDMSYVTSLFKGTKVVNGQSVKLQPERVLLES